MKARRLDDGGMSVILDQREWRIFSALLAQYASGLDRPPPPSHSSKDPLIEESNTWLREMQATHRQNLVKRAATWLETGSSSSTEDSSQKMLRLSGHDVEWMLQVFNDLRVSHWMLLGCPNEVDLKGEKWTDRIYRIQIGDTNGLFDQAPSWNRLDAYFTLRSLP